MPIYEFSCRRCGTFSLLRTMAQRDAPAVCPTCRQAAARQVTAPNLSLMPAVTRTAMARNEKSRHEPGVLNRHRCGSSCGCGSRGSGGASAPGPGRKAKRSVEVPKLGKFETSRRGRRPWMLGH